MENILELARRRRSVRTFDSRTLAEAELEKLRAFAEGLENPYGTGLRFRFLDAKTHGLRCPVASGTELYVAAKIDRVPHAEEAFGHSFEQFVLYAQSLGVGTVWLGGTMNREAFEAAMELGANERMPCASPLGYPAKKMSVKEIMMRKAIAADSRMPFSSIFFDGAFSAPLTEEGAGALRAPLEAVRLAPSAVNKQPWRAVAAGADVHFYLRHGKGFLSDAVGDMQKVDMGIALCHFELAAREAGLAPSFRMEDPGLETEAGMEYIASYRIAR